MTDFLDRVIAGMEVSGNCARVSVVTFGSAATLQFDLHAYADAGSLGRAIRGLHMRNQSRDFASGIRKVRSQVFQGRYGDRKDATNMCVLVTDGTSGAEYANSKTEVARAKADGVAMQIIGIGRNVSMSELSSLATATHLNDYIDLEGDDVLQQVFAYMPGEC
ncbi:hypothetical protein NP493_756g00055 [Ridgeia piscesae]|uniref:VWFA domain-containing protein n=1 Tax=Ridgeia piscesae TaxID=27915 RepID=A0AAD9KPM7_RIDPI|nr:hypothetical protein NP493_756g00055 [Ridgeia piscesae]